VEGGAPGSPGSARAAVERRAKEREAKQAKLKAGHIRPGKNSWTLIETKMGPVNPPLAETWIKTWKENTKTTLKPLLHPCFWIKPSVQSSIKRCSFHYFNILQLDIAVNHPYYLDQNASRFHFYHWASKCQGNSQNRKATSYSGGFRRFELLKMTSIYSNLLK